MDLHDLVTKMQIRLLGPLLAGSLLLALVPASAAAEVQLREFTGRIQEIDGGRIVVDSRMDDRMIFVRFEQTAVRGRRSAWSELEREDWVTVSWKFVDRPKKAYVVRVLPPRRGED